MSINEIEKQKARICNTSTLRTNKENFKKF